ncbi:hypothetical protein BW723_13950 [Polaribacter reichenbachii]|uniref:Apea-like HEPN domain-containing protein n=1 Tax=Polaribacter reichenbachii TaxID=996801 RepID=A0A1B8U1I6_9FLAO|nr:hypothetical protein [Polaribacter reichenbachii]APZ47319.1 hypothetical protein BW723_13950 [Polaribacter reichenbachii]AUC17960.1 hypothetical protein BTO17_04405 [Polaribacter reichenbachii]OBY65715.1 hypothetical protein LPB301_07830 [Polaribacter reichenbachii]
MNDIHFLKDNIRYGCWLIDNINFSGEEFKKQIIFKNQKIDLLITDYKNLKKLKEPFKDWIYNKLINNGMMYSKNSPLPINSIFIIALNGYENQNSTDFTHLFQLCLRLVYFSPSLVSSTSEYIPKGAIVMPNWDGYKNCSPFSRLEINPTTFEKAIEYFNILSSLNVKYSSVLEEIYKITGINEILLELLSLYSFIEGFWSNDKETTNLKTSFNRMLSEDYAPGRENKFIRKSIINKIENQNGLLRNRKLDDMRHILAHGIYKREENTWNKEQWDTIYTQRDLLIELVIESLINKMKKT